jgi:hypothetical protein
VGFATNGTMAGGGPLIIPITRSPIQTSMILETLARVTMASEGHLTDILSKGYNLPWGVSCLAFACEPGEATTAIEASMRNRKVPTLFVHARPGAGLPDGRYPGGAMSTTMEEIRTREEREP